MNKIHQGVAYPKSVSCTDISTEIAPILMPTHNFVGHNNRSRTLIVAAVCFTPLHYIHIPVP